MAQEEIQKPAASITASVPVKEDTPAPVKEVEVPVATEKAVAAPAPEEKVVSEKEVPVVAVPETEVTAVKEEEVVTGKEILQSESFKEEGYLASELPEAEKNALAELKEMVREALNKREFTAPPPAPAKEEKVEEKKTEETEEKKEEVKTEEKSVEAETKTEEKSAAPATVETKKEEILAAPAPIVAETKKEEKSVAPTPVETTPAAPVVAETKKEEISAAPTPVETKPAAPVTTETKVEEKVVPVETTPAAPVVTETKEEEKAAPVVDETKKEEKASASAPVKRAVSKFIKDIFVSVTTTEKKKEEEKPAVVTIEKAFAADQEEETKTVEATEASIVSITLPETAAYVEPEEVSIWGIPLLEDERSDVILLKFLRARDFKVKEAFTMLKNTVQWRKENNIDDLVSEDLEGSEFEKLVFTHGVDKQGHVVIYSSYSEFQNKEIFSDKEKLSKFLKWRIQFQEKCVRSLDFSPEAKSSFVFVSDFRNAPGLGQRALWQFIKRAVKQFEDNYPEFVAKEVKKLTF